MKRFFPGLLLGILISFPATIPNLGCKATLDQAGVYAGDTTAYGMDLSISTSKNVIENFLVWEKANRPLLAAKYPEVRAYADKLRAQAPAWLQSAVKLRDAYAANPSSAGKTAFDQTMAVLDQAVTEAQKYFAQSVKGK